MQAPTQPTPPVKSHLPFLLVEVGNSTIKLAHAEAAGDFRVERFARMERAVAAINHIGLPVLLAPVARERSTELAGLQVPVHAITHHTVADFVGVSYDTPGSLGLDRVLNLIGLDAPGIVISCGTAITVDALGLDGGPVWGAIMPGFTTAAEGLHARVPALPAVLAGDDVILPARTSRQSVANGVVLGTARAAQALAGELAELAFAGAAAPVTLTGGDAARLRALWRGEPLPVVNEHLLFGAMARIGADQFAP